MITDPMHYKNFEEAVGGELTPETPIETELLETYLKTQLPAGKIKIACTATEVGEVFFLLGKWHGNSVDVKCHIILNEGYELENAPAGPDGLSVLDGPWSQESYPFTARVTWQGDRLRAEFDKFETHPRLAIEPHIQHYFWFSAK